MALGAFNYISNKLLAVDFRLSAIERFQARMADIRISRHPQHRDCLFIVNNTEFDIYQDSTSEESIRVLKQVVVQKNPDLSYVQESFGADALVDDGEKVPWVVNMTCLGLPRLPMVDDRFIIDGVTYSVSRVKPSNRDMRGLLECLVYPERTDLSDPLALFSVQFFEGGKSLSFSEAKKTKDAKMLIIWGGFPTELSWDGVTWFPFDFVCPAGVIPVLSKGLRMRDVTGRVVTMDLSDAGKSSSVSESWVSHVGRAAGVEYWTPEGVMVYVN